MFTLTFAFTNVCTRHQVYTIDAFTLTFAFTNVCTLHQVYTIDAFTGRMLSYMEEHVHHESDTPLIDMFTHVNNPRWVVSHPVLRATALGCVHAYMRTSGLVREDTD